MSKKIAVIGGGSPYVAGIMNTLVNHAEELAGSSVVLEDIQSERQETILALGRNLIRARGADLKISATLNLDEALDGADFVITCFRIGGREALNLDVTIPARYDVHSGETAGPGGMFFALRTIPVVVDIAQRMEQLCPDAFMINYANPTAFVADAVRRTSSIKELSLCDGFMGVPHLVEWLLGHPKEDVIAFTAGINHFTWLLHAYVNGKDVAPELVQKLPETIVADTGWAWRHAVEIATTYKCMPSPGSHMVDYLFRSDLVARQEAVKHWAIADPGKVHAAVWKHYEELAKADDPQFDMSIPGMEHLVGSVSDLAVAVIMAIITDARKLFVANLPNIGQISNLPHEAIVEGPVVIGAFGAQPIAVGDIPETLLPITEILARNCTLTVDAALSGDRQMLFYALMSNPLVDSITKATPMMEEMLKAQAKWLPQFAG